MSRLWLPLALAFAFVPSAASGAEENSPLVRNGLEVSGMGFGIVRGYGSEAQATFFGRRASAGFGLRTFVLEGISVFESPPLLVDIHFAYAVVSNSTLIVRVGAGGSLLAAEGGFGIVPTLTSSAEVRLSSWMSVVAALRLNVPVIGEASAGILWAPWPRLRLGIGFKAMYGTDVLTGVERVQTGASYGPYLAFEIPIPEAGAGFTYELEDPSGGGESGEEKPPPPAPAPVAVDDEEDDEVSGCVGAACPVPDYDADGIADEVDRCWLDPENRDGIEDEDGCPEPPPGSASPPIETVYFDLNDATLKPESQAKLAVLSQWLAEHRTSRQLFIEGHADKTGGEELNEQLAERRAQAVAAFLLEKGVDQARLTTRGFGASRPVPAPSQAEAHAKSRRVEIYLVNPRAAP